MMPHNIEPVLMMLVVVVAGLILYVSVARIGESVGDLLGLR